MRTNSWCDHILSWVLSKTPKSLLKRADAVSVRWSARCCSFNPEPFVPSRCRGVQSSQLSPFCRRFSGRQDLSFRTAHCPRELQHNLLRHWMLRHHTLPRRLRLLRHTLVRQLVFRHRRRHHTLSYSLQESGSAYRLHQELHVASPPAARVFKNHRPKSRFRAATGIEP